MRLVLVILIISLSISSLAQELPTKISRLPVGIEITHSIDKVLATVNEDYPKRGGKYKWKYQTSVSAIDEDLKIIEFGGYILENNKWIEKNLGRRPFNNEEFEKWYKCPNGILKLDMTFTDTNNWGTSNQVNDIDAKTLWYYIGVNSANKEFVGYAEIEMIGKLK